ncbi:MAG: CDP-diacylglycerol--glycerol-3-phosphate 3-phosphatidyltransferase [Alphaproteobacteria bacterium MarineAlpha9_Bin4]|nr:MAG: CDP-diacylglycerol--glycerol-3-phosphate 3-phosphatidyltransferase [Alphaproteobacteria bacterium MarineAlpha9_Bin4]|tara:strand:- start:1484 stop:2074 length:591 start_codon:yes stop_codon:yes gene_type:complete
MKNIPNILTTIRLASPAYFILVILFIENVNIQTLILFYIFIFLSTTDYLDGFLARRFNITSNYGKIFDPISDKVLTSSALLFLISIENKILIPATLIIFREFLISGTREFSLISKNSSIKVSYLSKIKTTLQFFILSSLLLLFSFQENLKLNQTISIEKLINLCNYGLWIVTFLTLYTGFQYCSIIYNKEKKGKKK